MTTVRQQIAYMDMAERLSALSYATRMKVGCIIVKDDIMFTGYNGTPPKDDNNCESTDNETLEDVIHAEINAIEKFTRSNMSSVGADMYCTHQPCLPCARRIRAAGISRVFYRHRYRLIEGLEYLWRYGIDARILE